jgi:hypothetical protein
MRRAPCTWWMRRCPSPQPMSCRTGAMRRPPSPPSRRPRLLLRPQRGEA